MPAHPAAFRFSAVVLTALAFVLGGCTTTRYVTSWLRTTTTHPVELIAESGGNNNKRTTEELFEGKWVVVSNNDEAMSIHGGALVVYRGIDGYVLLDRGGHARPLDCKQTLRESARLRALDCIEFGPREDLESPFRVVWRHYKENSELLGEYRVALEGLPAAWSFEPDFIGFTRNGSPLISLHDRDGVDGIGARRCVLYAVGPDRLVLVDAYDAPSAPPCGGAGFWRSLSIEVVEGNTPE